MSASVKTTRRLLGALAALLVLGAGRAGAQALRPAAERLAGRLDAGTRAQVLTLVDSAGREGLPVEPLVDKALEGASKGAPGPRIVLALRTLAGELGAAREALGRTASDPEVAAAAGALHIGVSGEELAELQKARGRQPITVALGVLSDLVARGVPADSATAAVLTLTEASVDDDELVEFRRSVERDIALGAPPAAAASVRMNAFAPATLSDGLEQGARGGNTRPRRP